MRLCLVNEFFYPDVAGGTGTTLSDLMLALRREHEDLEIDVVTSRNLYRSPLKASGPAASRHHEWKGKLFRFSGPAARRNRPDGLSAHEVWQGINIHRLRTPHPNGKRLPMRLAANLLYTLGASLFLLRRRYDLVVVATAPPMAALAARAFWLLTGTPYLYIVYDLEPDRAVNLGVVRRRSLGAGIFRYLQHLCLQSSAKVIALGRCMKAHLSSAYGIGLEKIESIPIGFDPQSVWPEKKQSRFRAAHGLKGSFVVLYSGNLGRYHDFDTVLDAAKRLWEIRKDVRFVFVGGGYQREHIAARIAQEKIKNAALYDFVARVDLPDLLATADVSLVTLEPKLEGLCVPSKFYSIMASGRPILAIASPNTEMAWVIEETGCGVRVDHRDTEQLIHAVINLADHADGAERMGANGRKALVEKFAISEVARAYYRVICEAVYGDRMPSLQGAPADAEAVNATNIT